jgi:hypothetical protein
MGLRNSPAYFQQQLSIALTGLLGQIVELFIDDLIIFAKSEEELLQRMEMILERLRQLRITVKREKCQFGLSEVKFLGFIIDGKGTRIDQSRIDSLTKMPTPSTLRELRAVIGSFNFIGSYIQNFAVLISPLHSLV